MDKVRVVGIVVAAAGLVGSQIYFAQQTQKANLAAQQAQQQAQASATPASTPDQAGKTGGNPPGVTPGGDQAAAQTPQGTPAAAPVAKEEKVIIRGGVEYTFSNLGGGIERAKLLNHQSEKGNVVLNEFGTTPIGAVGEIAGEGLASPYQMKVDEEAGEVIFERTDGRGIQITKKFILPKLEGLSKDELLRNEYVVRLEVSFANRGAQPVPIPAYFVYTGSIAPLHQRDILTYIGFNFYHEGSNKLINPSWFDGGGWFSRRQASETYSEAVSKIRWAGVTNQYYTSVLTPDIDERANTDEQAKHYGTQVWAKRFIVKDEDWLAAGRSMEGKGKQERYGVDGALGMAGATLQPAQTLTQGFTVFTGPREYRRLKALGNNVAEMMDFGMYGVVSKPLLNSLNLLKGWLGNYGWAIVVLTLIIKGLLWPLQNKATKSMKKMQAVQPKMNEVREKYKDDPTRLNMEIMKLYKDYGINPLSGCLPMLIQIPIFFGFYSMLGRAVELRNSPFIGWIHDLSQPDTVAHFLGYPINVLPLIMAATMLFQMKIQPKSGDPAQQRMFMFMPLVFIFFCYNYASGLALYFTVQNLFSIVQLLLTRNQTAELPAVTPASKKKRR